MESSPCNLNILESDMNVLRDLLFKSSDPALSSINIDEESIDAMHLMSNPNDDLLSYVDVKFNNDLQTYAIPLVTIPNVKSIVIDSNVCSDLIGSEDSLSLPISSDQILIQTVEPDNVGHINTNTTVEPVKSPVENDVDVLLENSVIDEEITETSQNEDKEDEITVALLSIGITNNFFIKSSGQNSKKIQLWSCPLVKCNFNTVKVDTFKIHLLKHFGKRPFKCKHSLSSDTPCSWAFYSKSKLQRHENIHSKEKNWTCEYEGCHKKFNSKSYLKCHMVRHEKAQEHYCPLPSCRQSFNTMTLYHSHMKLHTATHKCEFKDCNKSFHSVSALQSHSRIHMKDPVDLKCQLCEATFKAPCRLQAHFNELHENVRNFKCTFKGCKWAFATNSKLRRHMNTHLNIKKFTCSVSNCAKSYLRSEHLQEHSKSHLKDKSKYKCSYESCHLSFCAKSSLYAHLKYVHSS